METAPNRKPYPTRKKQIPLIILLPRETIAELTDQAKASRKPRARFVRELIHQKLQEGQQAA